MKDYIKQIADGRLTRGEVIERLKDWSKDSVKDFLDDMVADAVVILMDGGNTPANQVKSNRLSNMVDSIATELLPGYDKLRKPTQPVSRNKQPKSNSKNLTDAAMKLEGLTDIYQKLVDGKYIVDGYWVEKSPACFWTLVYELWKNYDIDNAGLAWTDVARWVGVPKDDMEKLIHSAQEGYRKNTSDPKKSRVKRAAEIRIICQK